MEVTLHTTSRFFEAVAREAVGALPSNEIQARVEWEEPAEIQEAVGFETIFLWLSQPSVTTFLVSAGLGAAATLGKEVVKDLYSWVKSKLFRNAAEQDASRVNPQAMGLVMIITERGGEVGERHDFRIRYKCRDLEYGQARPFEERLFLNYLRPFENVLSPAIAHWSANCPLKGVRVEGFIGPADPDPQWTLQIHGPPDVAVTARIDLSGAVLEEEPKVPVFDELGGDAAQELERTRQLEVRRRESFFREALEYNRPFRIQTSRKVVHWKNCERMKSIPSSELHPVINLEEAVRLGCRPCDSCFLSVAQPGGRV